METPILLLVQLVATFVMNTGAMLQDLAVDQEDLYVRATFAKWPMVLNNEYMYIRIIVNFICNNIYIYIYTCVSVLYIYIIYLC